MAAIPFPSMHPTREDPRAAAQRRPMEPRTPRGPGHLVMDDTNATILQALAYKGRTTMHEISELVGRTESTVRERVANMERQGILMGYEARIDWARVGLPLEVVLEADCAPDKAVEVARALQKVPHVVHAIVTTGSPNLLAILKARDMGDVHKVLAGLASAPLQGVQVRITMEDLVAQRPPHPPLANRRETVRDLPAPSTLPSYLQATQYGMQGPEAVDVN